MAIEITLKLPESLIEHAKQLGQVTQRDVDAVLADALEMMWLTVENLPSDDEQQSVATLSDDAVVRLAHEKMDAVQNQRLGDLQAKGKESGLSTAERCELLALLQIYQLGQLRKSKALAEAVKRGLIALES